jgi:hypothetical protein
MIAGLAFDITTTAVYSGPISVCFSLPAITDPSLFSRVRVLHGENGTLVDRTTSQDFTTKTVCGTVDSLSPFAVAIVITPQAIKQSVLDQLIALRQTVNNQEPGAKLEDAIKKLSASLDPALWLDPSHLKPHGGEKDFEEEKQAVHNLRELTDDKKSSIPGAQLQQFIQFIVSADRELAQRVINDALAAGGNQQTIDRATNELTEGDADAASGKFEDAIMDYAEAWRTALLALRRS